MRVDGNKRNNMEEYINTQTLDYYCFCALNWRARKRVIYGVGSTSVFMCVCGRKDAAFGFSGLRPKFSLSCTSVIGEGFKFSQCCTEYLGCPLAYEPVLILTQESMTFSLILYGPLNDGPRGVGLFIRVYTWVAFFAESGKCTCTLR